MSLNYCYLIRRMTKREIAEQIIRDSHKEVEKKVYMQGIINPDMSVSKFICVEDVRVFEITDDNLECTNKRLVISNDIALAVLEYLRHKYYLAHRKAIHQRLTR